MPTNRTIIITFGFRHGQPPPVDLMVDARDVDTTDYTKWEQEAAEIAKHIEPGMVVGIGCHDGDDRSVQLANIIQKLLPDVVVVDRDLSPEAATQEDA